LEKYKQIKVNQQKRNKQNLDNEFLQCQPVDAIIIIVIIAIAIVSVMIIITMKSFTIYKINRAQKKKKTKSYFQLK